MKMTDTRSKPSPDFRTSVKKGAKQTGKAPFVKNADPSTVAGGVKPTAVVAKDSSDRGVPTPTRW